METLLLFMGSFIKVAPLSPIVASMQTIRHCEANPEIYRFDTNPGSPSSSLSHSLSLFLFIFPSVSLARSLLKKRQKERDEKAPRRQRASSSRSLLSTFRLEAHPKTSFGDKCS